MNEITYDIQGVTYVQRKLSFGQAEDVDRYIAGFYSGSATTGSMLSALMADMTWLIAIALVPAGKTVIEWRRTVPLSVWHDKLKYELLDDETAEKVVADFFDCNPGASVSGLLLRALEKIGKVAQQSETSSASSPAAT